MRLEMVARLGFEPTPERATEQIKKRLFLKSPGGPLVLGDPCCGEGVALRAMADHLKSLGADPVVTYGIEPDLKRASQAVKVLDNVVKDGYENTTISNQSFSLWWFNPPYDNTASDEDEKSERSEVVFLRNTYKYIIPHGVLVCIVQQKTLKHLAPILVNRFYDLSVERFDDVEFEKYRQVVVFGYKKPAGAEVGSKEEKEFLVSLSRADHEFIPSLDQEPVKTYKVPHGVVPKTFFGQAIDKEKVIEALPNSPVRRMFTALTAPKLTKVRLGTPLMTLKAGQYANIIASGALNGVVGKGADRHLVVGGTKKTINSTSEVDEDGNVTVTETEEFRSVVSLYTADGFYYELIDSNKVGD